MPQHINHETRVIDAEDIGHIVTQLIEARELGYKITVDVHQEYEDPSDIYVKNSEIVIRFEKGEEEVNASN